MHILYKSCMIIMYNNIKKNFEPFSLSRARGTKQSLILLTVYKINDYCYKSSLISRLSLLINYKVLKQPDQLMSMFSVTGLYPLHNENPSLCKHFLTFCKSKVILCLPALLTTSLQMQRSGGTSKKRVKGEVHVAN